jgi:hypothetical protein
MFRPDFVPQELQAPPPRSAGPVILYELAL